LIIGGKRSTGLTLWTGRQTLASPAVHASSPGAKIPANLAVVTECFDDKQIAIALEKDPNLKSKPCFKNSSAQLAQT